MLAKWIDLDAFNTLYSKLTDNKENCEMIDTWIFNHLIMDM